MTTETIQAPVAAENATAPETIPEGAQTPEVESETADEAELETAGSSEVNETEEAEADRIQAEVDKATRKARRRIDRLIAERAARDERLQRLEAELTEARKPANEDGTKPAPAEDPHEIAKTLRLVEKTAETTARVMKEAGKKFPDFEAAVAELVEEIGPQIDSVGRPSALIEAVFDSERAGEILYHLGKNPEIAAELVGLSASKLGRRIALIETELDAKAKPKTSAAPKPLAPVKASSPVVVDESKLSDAQWYAIRKKAKLAG